MFSNNQLKCNDLFGCLNRIWNSVDFETQEVVSSDASDTAKRKLLLLLLRDMDAERLVNLRVSTTFGVRPFIHDDNVSRLTLGTV